VRVPDAKHDLPAAEPVQLAPGAVANVLANVAELIGRLARRCLLCRCVVEERSGWTRGLKPAGYDICVRKAAGFRFRLSSPAGFRLRAKRFGGPP
jgi:hypothetical protein